MLIVMPSDPATQKASQYLTEQGIQHMVLDIPDQLEYKTGATTGIYLEGSDKEKIMLDLSAKGFIIMRVFKSFEVC